MNIILFVACRDKIKVKEEEKKDDLADINSKTIAPINKK